MRGLPPVDSRIGGMSGARYRDTPLIAVMA
jgi:hypothetical protein